MASGASRAWPPAIQCSIGHTHRLPSLRYNIKADELWHGLTLGGRSRQAIEDFGHSWEKTLRTNKEFPCPLFVRCGAPDYVARLRAYDAGMRHPFSPLTPGMVTNHFPAKDGALGCVHWQQS